jgi:hypothetical protein
VRNGVLLAEDMGAFEMNERLVVLVLAHERSGQRDLLLESLVLPGIHGRSWEAPSIGYFVEMQAQLAPRRQDPGAIACR